jgi:hypothetical protein
VAPHAIPIRLLVPILIGVLALAACAGDADSDASGRPPGASSLDLRPDGIGPFTVGDPAEDVIEGIAGSIGGWDADSADAESTLLVPSCTSDDGAVLPTRMVSWGNLVLLFTGTGPASEFHSWSYGFDPVTGNAGDVRSLGLMTEDGIGLGTERERVESVLGMRLSVIDDEALDLSTFTIDGAMREHLEGRFTSTGADAVVQVIEREPNCEIAVP